MAGEALEVRVSTGASGHAIMHGGMQMVAKVAKPTPPPPTADFTATPDFRRGSVTVQFTDKYPARARSRGIGTLATVQTPWHPIRPDAYLTNIGDYRPTHVNWQRRRSCHKKQTIQVTAPPPSTGGWSCWTLILV